MAADWPGLNHRHVGGRHPAGNAVVFRSADTTGKSTSENSNTSAGPAATHDPALRTAPGPLHGNRTGVSDSLI